ncbi:hypothetical protein T265_06876 [Opisthorchis viverrini]|uniref:Uncharacterized protein n=1 Tax=Opisthorchis viverrini TaxID=6198 RepID=A0A074ZEU9_OPIVI|nr:hypothetical protein T265_06876 [Opisthorchis viverrini]KER25703.1 hypothetical protein T265_06876 [Opisthorchis viverrini]
MKKTPKAALSLPGRAAYILLLMAGYWLTEVIPIYVTALFPVFLAPVLGLIPSSKICPAYMKDYKQHGSARASHLPSHQNPNLMREDGSIDVLDEFVCLSSSTNSGGLGGDEISSRIRKTRKAFGDLSHLWLLVTTSFLRRHSATKRITTQCMPQATTERP